MADHHRLVPLCIGGAIMSIFASVTPVAAGMILEQQPAARAAEAADEPIERDLSAVQKPIYDMEKLQGSSRYDIDAWVDKPSLTYEIGQSIRLVVRPRQTSYITVLSVGSSGGVRILYPNHFQKDKRVKAGTALVIPKGSSPWQIKVGGPTGIELIQVIASQRALTLLELGQLGRTTEATPTLLIGRSANDVARDLIPQLKPSKTKVKKKPERFGIRNLLVRIVPPGLSPTPAAILPPRRPSAVAPTVIMTNPTLGPALTSPYGLRVRPERAVYKVGEGVRMVVSSQKDCRLTLIDVGTGGIVLQLFPNAFQNDTLIRANQHLLIPSPQAPFRLVARGPTGVEGVIATCRPAGLSDPVYPLAAGSDSFAVIGTIQTIGRDLLVTSGETGINNQVEQASASYLVVE